MMFRGCTYSGETFPPAVNYKASNTRRYGHYDKFCFDVYYPPH